MNRYLKCCQILPDCSCRGLLWKVKQLIKATFRWTFWTSIETETVYVQSRSSAIFFSVQTFYNDASAHLVFAGFVLQVCDIFVVRLIRLQACGNWHGDSRFHHGDHRQLVQLLFDCSTALRHTTSRRLHAAQYRSVAACMLAQVQSVSG